MKFTVNPNGSISGDINIPGDKSISHRAIMLGSIAKGTTTVSGFLEGEDCLATLKAFKQMGVGIEGPIEQRLVIHGVGKHGLREPLDVIDVGNSGTSIRLMAGLLSAQSFNSVLTGDESLLARPMERVSKPLSLMGAAIVTNEGKPPLSIAGNNPLHGIDYAMPVASAQVKSCLLLAGMYADGETVISEPGITRDHTERMLTSFSYPIKKSKNSVAINAEGECIATDIIIPGDISSATFFIVAASITPGSDLILRGVGINQTRIGVLHILKAMGADIQVLNKRLCGDEPVADLWVKHSPLEGIDIPSQWVPLAIDEFPAIFIAAAVANGRTVLKGAKELRVKESDRIEAMARGLKKLGADVETLEDGIIINGGKLQGGVVDSFGDHRIAMSFAVAANIAEDPIEIKDCDNVATSFPDFVAKANSVGFNLVESE